MVQSLKSKVRKLSQAYSITAIIDTARELQQELADEAVWGALTTEQKTEWFLAQCKKYNLTTKQKHNQISVNELPSIGNHKGTQAYFCVFLPAENAFRGDSSEGWQLEIGGAYIGTNNGGIWTTNQGLIGKERQIEQVMRLHRQGQ
jgi:hypothetical protein